MISEFRARQELAAIELVPDSTLGTTKRILRLARQVLKSSTRLFQVASWCSSVGDTAGAIRFFQAAHRTSHLYEHIRAKARLSLSMREKPLGFGYEPVAYWGQPWRPVNEKKEAK